MLQMQCSNAVTDTARLHASAEHRGSAAPELRVTAPSPPAPSTAARLRIHTEPDRARGRRSTLRRGLAWLERRGRPALQLRIADLQGRLFVSTEDSPPLLEATLPAGTYHVTALQGPVRRSYTVTLLDDSTLELYLRLPAP
jgi:hypothetical protein